MGWKGDVRKVRSAYRAAQRASDQASRARDKKEATRQKNAEYLQAEAEVEAFEEEIVGLRTLHTQCVRSIDWEILKSKPAPQPPTKTTSRQIEAQSKIDSYSSSPIDRLFRREETARKRLEEHWEHCRLEDEKENLAAIGSYDKAHLEWERTTKLAAEVCARENLQAYLDVIRDLGSFTKLPSVASHFDFRVEVPDVVEATILGRSESELPASQKTLLKSGKLSVKAMPKGSFYRLYQNHICSAVLRVAQDLFALLPIEIALVHVEDRRLDPQTGHLANICVLSVAIPRATLVTLNLRQLEPVASLGNFLHRAKLVKTKGLMPVEKLNLRDLPEALLDC